MEELSVSVMINIILQYDKDMSYQDVIDFFQQECNYTFEMPKNTPLIVKRTEWVETS